MKKSVIMDRLAAGKFVLIAEIGVNYYDIAKQRGISNSSSFHEVVTHIAPRSRQ